MACSLDKNSLIGVLHVVLHLAARPTDRTSRRNARMVKRMVQKCRSTGTVRNRTLAGFQSGPRPEPMRFGLLGLDRGNVPMKLQELLDAAGVCRAAPPASKLAAPLRTAPNTHCGSRATSIGAVAAHRQIRGASAIGVYLLGLLLWIGGGGRHPPVRG